MDSRNKFFIEQARKNFKNHHQHYHHKSSNNSSTSSSTSSSNSSNITKIFIKKNQHTVDHFIPLLHIKQAQERQRKSTSPPTPPTARPNSPLNLSMSTPVTPLNSGNSSPVNNNTNANMEIEKNIINNNIDNKTDNKMNIMPNQNSFMDIHKFDGQVLLNESKVNQIKSVIQNYKDKKQDVYNFLLSKSKDFFSSSPYYTNGINGINMIIVNTNTRDNVVNDIYADDLILYIGVYVSKQPENIQKDIIHLLLEQMFDCYTTGRCPIGRVNRLIMLINSFP